MNQPHDDPSPYTIRALASDAAKGHVAALADIAGLALATGVTRRQGWIYLPDATKPIARTWAEFGEFISDGLTGRARIAAVDMARVLAKQGADLSAAEARAVAMDRAKAADQQRTWVNAVMSHGGLTIRQAEQAVRDEAHAKALMMIPSAAPRNVDAAGTFDPAKPLPEDVGILRRHLDTLNVQGLRRMAGDMRYRWEASRADLVDFLLRDVPQVVREAMASTAPEPRIMPEAQANIQDKAMVDAAHQRANLIETMAREFYIHAGYIGVSPALQERDADLADWQSGKVPPSMRDMAYQYAHAIDTITHQQ